KRLMGRDRPKACGQPATLFGRAASDKVTIDADEPPIYGITIARFDERLPPSGYRGSHPTRWSMRRWWRKSRGLRTNAFGIALLMTRWGVGCSSSPTHPGESTQVPPENVGVAVEPLNPNPELEDFVLEATTGLRLQSSSRVTGGDIGALGNGSASPFDG